MSFAVIAGEGTLPEEIVSRLSAQGKKPIVYAMREDYDAMLEDAVEIIPVFKAELASAIKDMSSRGIKQVLFAGFVPKTLIYRPEMMDSQARKLVNGLENRDDHSILGGIVAAFE